VLSTLEPVATSIEIPSRRYGKYQVRSRLGVGGMAEVFLADVVNELGEEQQVALKIMRDGQSHEAFVNEADLMGMLSHPNLVRRLELGEAGGRLFIAMEYCMGGDLQGLMNVLRKHMKDFPTWMGVHVCLEVLKGLSYFHQAKTRSGDALHLVHGDVNPSNVFFSAQGDVKLGDFGVAKSARKNLGPQDGLTAGKVPYLSPEQTRGDPLTAASDLFAVGVMLHELTVGFHPFAGPGASAHDVLAAIRAARVTIPDYVDKPLAQVLRRVLAADLSTRYPTAGEMAGDLLHYALDHGQWVSREQVQAWLATELGLLC
jgi:eukaryotic-like serine/threonine-protein kinase